MNSKIFLTGLMSLVMANASLAPVLANPVIEQKRTEKQEVQDSSAQNSVVLTPATKDTPGAVQMIPVKDYIALKGEASLEGKQILEVMPQSSARNKNDKDSDKNNKKTCTMITRPNDKKCTFLHHNKVNKNMSKITQETKHYILDLVREQYPKFTKELSSLNGQSYVNSYLQLLKFIVPTQRSVTQTIETQNEIESIW